jgi:protein gp37
LGISAERQQEADERVPLLLKTPAAIRFVSAEPLIGPIDFCHIPMSAPDENTVFRTINALTGVRGHGGKFGYTETGDPIQPHLSWIIIGGESGPKHRPMEEAWAASILRQCNKANVAAFMKQMAGKAPIPPHLMVRQFPNPLRVPQHR